MRGEISVGNSFVLLFLGALISIGQPAFAKRVTVTELGTLGGDFCTPSDINNSGKIVGWSSPAGGYYSDLEAFLWTIEDRILGLGTLGGYGSKAVAINDAGFVAGTNYFDGGYRAFYWSNEKGMVDLGTLGGSQSEAVAINASGQIAGWSSLPTISYTFSPFFWSLETGLVDLGSLGGVFGKPIAINEQGHITGWSSASPTSPGEKHGFLWTPQSGMVDLGTLGGQFSEPIAMNSADQILGWSSVSWSNGYTHAFVWDKKGGMVDLGTLGSLYSYPIAINESGKVLCRSYNLAADPRAFVVMPIDTDGDHVPDTWFKDDDGDGVNDLMTDLGTLGGWATYPVAMNDKGQIIGRSNLATGWSHAFLITPTDTDGDGLPNWYRDENGDGVNDLMTDLGTLGNSSEPVAINNQGQVVGKSDLDFHSRHAFFWTLEDGMVDLGTLGGEFSYPVDLNESGQIFGFAQKDDPQYLPVLWMFQPEVEVDIDVRPYDDTNTVNLGSAGVLEVAILSSEYFDARKVDPATVRLQGASVKLVGKGDKYLYHQEDVNDDGLMDFVCKVYTDELLLETGESRAVLEAETVGIVPIRGEDYLRIVPDR